MFLGHPRVIATAVLQGPAGVALVDPGPSTCLDRLRGLLREQGITIGDLRTVLLTTSTSTTPVLPARSCGTTRHPRVRA